MSLLIDSIKKGPVMTMTLECETEFPRALKDNMKNLGFEGAAVYKGFPFLDKGLEYWWVELHMYKSKDGDHKTKGCYMITNPILHTAFFESARSAAWEAIKYHGERLHFRLQNTQKYLDELKEIEGELDALRKKIN